MSEQKNNGYKIELPERWSREEWRAYYNSNEYEKSCACGKIHKLWTQMDENPEYYIDVHVICDCGDKVHFELPVN